jgi:HTH-type transcriptional regulator / antitoxin HipB
MKIDTPSLVRTPYQLGLLLAECRASLGVDQADLADRLGTHRPSISNIENGKATIQTELIFAMLDALGLEISIRERAPT